MLCDEVSLILAEAVDALPVEGNSSGDVDLTTPAAATVDLVGLPAARHVEGCLRCQAEFVHYRRLRRNLRLLRDEHINPDPELLDEILDSVRPPATVHQLHRKERKIAYLSGIAAAATAGAAGALVWASKVVPGRKAS